MQLTQIQIENFRSFENETILFDDYTCFVGANGAGKSTILTALNVFFRNNASTVTDVCKLSEEDFHHKNTKKPIKITLTFEDLTEEEKEDFRHYYRQNKLILFAKAEWNIERQSAEVVQHGSRMVMHEFKSYFEANDKGQKVDVLKKVYSDIRKKYNDLPDVKVKGQMYQALRDYEENHLNLCKPLDEPNQLYGWTKGENKLKKVIEWVYVPAVKDASSEQDESKQTALGQLLDRTIRSKIDFEEPISRLKSETEEKYKSLIDKHNSILFDIKDSLQKRLRDWATPGANLDLNWHYDNEKTIKIDEPNARVRIGEGKFIGEVARLGHGMQRAFLLSILQELAGSNQDTSPRLLLGIEEPELYQHPPQAQHMANLLLNLAAEKKNKTQVIASTHSPYFVSCEKFEKVRMVRKCYTKEVSSVTGTTYEKLEKRLSNALGTKPGSPTSLMARVSQIMYPSQSELFFSSLPVLVEGIEDVAYLSTQLALSGQTEEFKRLGCHFIIASGKKNMSRLVAIALDLKQPVYVIFDGDADNEIEKVKNQRDNSCILNLLQIKSDPLPAETLWDRNAIMWSSNLTKVVHQDFDGEWDKTTDQIRQEHNYTDGVRGKNKLLIAAALEKLHENEKQSSSLIRACGQLLKYAEEIQHNNI